MREAELRRDYHLVSDGNEGFAKQFFIAKRTIDFRRIEERHAAFDRGANKRATCLLVNGRPVPVAQSHTAEPDCRHFQIASSQFPLLRIHLFSTRSRAFPSRVPIPTILKGEASEPHHDACC